MPPAQYVTMQMRHGFPCVRSIVEHETVARLFEPERLCDFRGLEQQMTQRLLILNRRFRYTRDRPFWNDKNVSRCLRFDVAKRQHQIVFVHDRCGNLSRGNLFEKSLAHRLAAWIGFVEGSNRESSSRTVHLQSTFESAFVHGRAITRPCIRHCERPGRSGTPK